jgi:SAM-dependent methyltransferase
MDPEENRRGWAERSAAFSPAYYAHIGPDEVSDTLVTVLDRFADEDAAILEVGCSAGRHLAHLRQAGFTDLAGVDINDDSFDVMAEQYPGLAETGTFRTGAIEDVLPTYADGAFDGVYSVQTLQHVHPESEWVFAELVRVTGDLLVTAENEGDAPDRGRTGHDVSRVNDEFPLYYRDWERVFTGLGLVPLACESEKRDTVRAFRVP